MFIAPHKYFAVRLGVWFLETRLQRDDAHTNVFRSMTNSRVKSVGSLRRLGRTVRQHLRELTAFVYLQVTTRSRPAHHLEGKCQIWTSGAQKL